MNSTLGYVSWSTEEKNVAILLDMPYTVLIFKNLLCWFPPTQKMYIQL